MAVHWWILELLDPDDRAWYYSDGRNWFTYGNNAWNIYNFDKSFGR